MSIVKSSGLVVVYNEELLLVHPKNASWVGTFSIPKGKIKDFESPLEAAIRETREETGIDFSSYFEGYNGLADGVILYKKKNKKSGLYKTYKKVFYYIVRINEKPEIKNKIQNDEIDWTGFVSKNEINKKIFWRFLPILDKAFQ